jgi:hypothetical protein
MEHVVNYSIKRSARKHKLEVARRIKEGEEVIQQSPSEVEKNKD